MKIKVKIQYSDLVNIFHKTKELSFLKGDEALSFYRDRVKLEDAFRPETTLLHDLYAKKQEVYQELETHQDDKNGDAGQQIPTRLRLRLDSIELDIEKTLSAEKEVEITRLPWSKFKEAGLTDLKTIEVFGKIIDEEA